jgi:hypothetical protein
MGDLLVGCSRNAEPVIDARMFMNEELRRMEGFVSKYCNLFVELGRKTRNLW